MLREAIQLLNTNQFIDGNDLPDSAPGHTYQFRSCSPNMIVVAPGMKSSISKILKDNGFAIKSIGTYMLKISK